MQHARHNVLVVRGGAGFKVLMEENHLNRYHV
jgi:hypothetical protein